MFQWRAHALHNDCVTLTNVDSRQLLVIGKYLIYIFVVRHTPWIKVLNEEIPARDLKFARLALQPDTVATAREINKYIHTLSKTATQTSSIFPRKRSVLCLPATPFKKLPWIWVNTLYTDLGI